MRGILFRPLHARPSRRLAHRESITALLTMFLLIRCLLLVILRDGDTMLKGIQRVMPLPPDGKQRLFSMVAEASQATIEGTLTLALLQGALGGLAFAVLGIQGKDDQPTELSRTDRETADPRNRTATGAAEASIADSCLPFWPHGRTRVYTADQAPMPAWHHPPDRATS